jgi:hypothetical protein
MQALLCLGRHLRSEQRRCRCEASGGALAVPIAESPELSQAIVLLLIHTMHSSEHITPLFVHLLPALPHHKQTHVSICDCHTPQSTRMPTPPTLCPLRALLLRRIQAQLQMLRIQALSHQQSPQVHFPAPLLPLS